jgi:uroporphyrin-III C-methyltransferase
VLYFRSHGFEPLVIPGVSSALAGPLMAGIPVTQRGVAESLMICTGVGRQGKEVRLPGYERSRTLVILMGVARIAQLLLALTRTGGGTQRGGAAYPPYTPIAVIERASCPDQRVVLSTLEGIEAALERSGEQRPPGMIVIGWSVLALHGTGDLTVLDEGEVEDLDRARITKWLGDIGYLIHNGLKGWGIGDNV